MPAEDAAHDSIMQHIEDFLLGQLLPLLGPAGNKAAAAVEAAVSDELLDLHLANAQLGQRLTKWCVPCPPLWYPARWCLKHSSACVAFFSAAVMFQSQARALVHFTPCCTCRMAVAQEMQELVQLQQQELQRLQQQQELEAQQHSSRLHAAGASAWHGGAGPAALEAANAELRQQLQGATSRLQDMETAMSQLLNQQVGCCGAEFMPHT
jgi:hypothetical protein